MEVKKPPWRPDTYFIQDAVDLAIGSILNRLDRELDFQPYFWIDLESDPPEARHLSWDYCDMSGRYVDALILGRQITGNQRGRVEEKGLRRFLLSMQDADGLFYDQDSEWSTYQADMFCQSRVLLGLVSWYMLTKEAKVRASIDRLIEGLQEIITDEKDYGYYQKNIYSRGEWRSGGLEGTLQALPLMKYFEITGEGEALSLAGKLIKYFIYHSHKVVFRDGSYHGASHAGGILPSTVAALKYGIATGNQEIINWVKRVYKWTRAHSLSSFGWLQDIPNYSSWCETCSLTDLIHLAIILAKNGHPEYWNDVERIVRNQLLENQFRHVEWIISKEAQARSRTKVASILLGSFESWALPNSLLGVVKDPRFPFGVEGCCTGAGIRGLFLAWDHIVTKTERGVFVNLAFSRDSEWVEVISYRDYEGKVVFIIHDAPVLHLRIPDWVRHSEVKVFVDGVKKSTIFPPARVWGEKPQWEKDYIKIEGLSEGQVVTVKYPLRRMEELEVVDRKVYRVVWKGDTVIKIWPKGKLYPIYQREYMDLDKAPLTEKRYGAAKTVKVHW